LNCSFKKFVSGVPGIIGGSGIGDGRNDIDVEDDDDDNTGIQNGKLELVVMVAVFVVGGVTLFEIVGGTNPCTTCGKKCSKTTLACIKVCFMVLLRFITENKIVL
jgi:hypothetical protein